MMEGQDSWACICPERKKPVEHRSWAVIDRLCNYSAFNGYHYTESDYSCVVCCECHCTWRTKAAYVSKLRDYDREKYLRGEGG